MKFNRSCFVEKPETDSPVYWLVMLGMVAVFAIVIGSAMFL